MKFELFYCEIYSCRLTPERCIRRQKIARGGHVRGKSPDGRQYWRCRDCAQGRDVEAGNVATAPLAVSAPESKERRETVETRICSDPKCAHAGEARPIGDFPVHSSTKKPMKICRECMARRISEGHEKNRRGGPAELALPKANRKKKKSARIGKGCLVVDFADHPGLLEWLASTAAQELRTPENQLLWLARSYRSNEKEA